MRLIYKTRAKNFNEALPLGNGKIGVMCYGFGKYSFSEATLYSGKICKEEPSQEMLLPMSFIKDGLYGYEGRINREAKIFRAKLEEVKKLIVQKRYSKASKMADEWLQGGFSQSFMSFGKLHLNFKDESLDYERELNLENALHLEKIKFAKSEVFIKSSINDNHFEVELESSVGINFSLDFKGALIQSSFFSEDYFVAYGKCPSYASPYREDEAIIFEENEGIGFLGGLKLLNYKGKLKAKASHLEFIECKKLHFAFNITSGFLGFQNKPISDGRSLFSAFKKSFNEGKKNKILLPLQSAQKDFSYCQTLQLREKFTILFNYGFYLFQSGQGKEALNLQGIWNESLLPAWSSNYTLNINLQMNYWLAPFLGKGIEGLLRLCEELSISGARVAKELYGARGWVVHHNSDIFRHAYPTGNGAQHTLWAMGSAWLVLTLWRFVEFNPLSEFRTRIKSLLLPSCLFYVDTLSEIEGVFHTLPSSSPENSFLDPKSQERACIAKSSSLDISLLKELFSTTLKVLKKDNKHYKELKNIYENLAKHQIDERGEIAEWYEKDLFGIEKNHRHLSHLYDLYPADGFYKDEKLLQAAIKSLESRGLGGTGWSLVWKIAIYARLKRAEEVKKLFKILTQKAQKQEGEFNHLLHNESIDFVNGGGMYENFTLAHPPFQIDASLGISAALMELFVQSHRGYIEILPCYFEELGEGKIQGLRLKDGISFELEFKANEFEMELWADFGLEREIGYKGKIKNFRLGKERLKLSEKDFK